ncbi:hypothetical protein [Campylobacter sp. RM16192]|uniref:hypothetical protein n=1 Tax=Campylobacter sp. RM16192 TaxID=1660080 RepID=UPI0014523E7D|nr:hypothetical protein [Campylobacter sp. RM16192]QCD52476.1 hypothetical protein CDOMC_0853 [Campylobacter sp. RM16192]
MNDTWITSKEARELLRLKGANILWTLSKKGLIKRNKVNSRVCYYSKNSILAYISGQSLER